MRTRTGTLVALLALDTIGSSWSFTAPHALLSAPLSVVQATRTPTIGRTNNASSAGHKFDQDTVFRWSSARSAWSGLSTTALFSLAVEDRQETETSDVSSSGQKKSFRDDGFVFGLEGSGLDRPKGKVANVVVEGDSLETQPYQVAMVSATLLAHAGFATASFGGMIAVNGGNVAQTALQAAALFLSSWILADFGSGVLHWAVDNYGNGRTPVFGSIIAAFQGHHSAPWTIAERGFCNNVYKLCIPFGIVPMAAIKAVSGPFTAFFFTVFCVMEILSQVCIYLWHVSPIWLCVSLLCGIKVLRILTGSSDPHMFPSFSLSLCVCLCLCVCLFVHSRLCYCYC